MSSKRRGRELAIETLSILAERFPAAFLLRGHRRPLKIGIDRDLAEAAPDLAAAAIKQALRIPSAATRAIDVGSGCIIAK